MRNQSTEWMRYKVGSVVIAVTGLVLFWISNGQLVPIDLLILGVIAITPFVLQKFFRKTPELSVQQKKRKHLSVFTALLVTEIVVVVYPHFLLGQSWRESISQSGVVIVFLVFLQVNAAFSYFQADKHV